VRSADSGVLRKLLRLPEAMQSLPAQTAIGVFSLVSCSPRCDLYGLPWLFGFVFSSVPDPTRFSHSSSRFSMSETCSTIGEERLPAKPHSFVISSKAPSGRLGKSDM